MAGRAFLARPRWWRCCSCRSSSSCCCCRCRRRSCCFCCHFPSLSPGGPRDDTAVDAAVVVGGGGRKSRPRRLLVRALITALLGGVVLLNLYYSLAGHGAGLFGGTDSSSSFYFLADGVGRPTEYLQLYSPRPRYNVVALARALHERQDQQRRQLVSPSGRPPTTFINSTFSDSPPLLQQLPPHQNITAAICYKTLFGVVQLDHVMKWAAYHRLLGFSHIFMWYLPQVASYPYFEQLSALPFVTLLENTDFQPVRMGKGPRGQVYDSMAGARNWTAPGAQLDLENRCRTQVAVNYTWILFMDTDEYLWFDRKQGVVEFLQDHGDNYHYLSFGKKLYTVAARPDPPLSPPRPPERQWPPGQQEDYSEVGFGLDRFAFTASGYFCHAMPPFDTTRKKDQSWFQHVHLLLRSHFCRWIASEAEKWQEDVVWGPRWQAWFFARDRWCFHELDHRRGNHNCPLHRGRAKVMIKVEKYRHARHSPVFIHGQVTRRQMGDGRIHVDPRRAHLKEWPWIFHNDTLTQLRSPQDFEVTSNAEINLHDLEIGLVPNRQGTWTFQYDGDLASWFEYVAQSGL